MSRRTKDRELLDISFYRLKRRDNVVRTGIEIGDVTDMGTVEGPEGEYPDPVLAWYIDLRIKGRKLPTQPEEVRQWFLDHSDVITSAFKHVAEEAQAGIDFATWMPYLWSIPNPPRGIQMTITCHASRRKDALTIAQEVSEMAKHWREWVKNMPVLETA
jgi:hypothetical protein